MGIVPPGDAPFAPRDQVFDLMLQTLPLPASDDIVVVDIDAPTLARRGAWPWPRAQLAGLVDAVADGSPKVIAMDIVLAGQDRFAESAEDRPPRLSAGDQAMARAIGRVPMVMAALMSDTAAGGSAVRPVILTSDPAPDLAPWRADAAIWPFAPLMGRSAAVGMSSLQTDTDGRVRRVPLFLNVGGRTQTGFALEAVRLASGASATFVRAPEAARGMGPAATVGVGDRLLPLTAAADMRVRLSGRADWAGRTLSADLVLEGGAARASLAGKIVLIGGSAPEMGGLRTTARYELTPSVQIHADAIAAMMAEAVPYRPDHAALLEPAAVALMIAIGLILGQVYGPAIAVGLGLAAAGVWGAGTGLVLRWQDQLIDPLVPGVAVLAATAVSVLLTAMQTRQQARRVRQRFEQHLPPMIVARIAAGHARMPREVREVTFLFTDLEGFTAATNRLGPTAMMAILDDYFAGLTRIVLAAGGNIDKIVGDAVHAMFNAPDDLADHATSAVRCALAIARFADEFRLRPDMAAAGLGRTRIGIETGTVIVGDVGGAAKLDYTAHGDAINTAARLEALNAALGTTICVGPGCRALVQDVPFRFHGEIAIKGRGRLAVFEPLAPDDCAVTAA
jgi:adenylate cyclase